VPCDEAFPGVIADVIQSHRAESGHKKEEVFSDLLYTAAATVVLASWRSSRSVAPSAGAA
jgi:hypothetical protein